MNPLPVEVPIRRMTPAQMADVFLAKEYRREFPCIVVEPQPEDPPPFVRALLSSTWGASSRAASILRQPPGFVFWHCDACVLPSSPSGRRLAGFGAIREKMVKAVCENMAALRRDRAANWGARSREMFA